MNAQQKEEKQGWLAEIWGTGRHANKNISCFLLVMVPIVPLISYLTKDPLIFEKSIPVISGILGFIAGFFNGRSQGCPKPKADTEDE